MVIDRSVRGIILSFLHISFKYFADTLRKYEIFFIYFRRKTSLRMSIVRTFSSVTTMLVTTRNSTVERVAEE